MKRDLKILLPVVLLATLAAGAQLEIPLAADR